MKSDSRKKISKLLNEVSLLFNGRGWELLERPKTSLYMRQSPTANVEHTLQLIQPFSAAELPTESVIGVSCFVNVFFSDLEEVINQALGRDTALFGKISFQLSLSSVVPKERLFAGSVYLLPIEEKHPESAAKALVADFDDFLEPTRRRLSNHSVFLDETFRPPGVSAWSWNVRRAVYYRTYGDTLNWRRLSSLLAEEADRLLAAPAANDFTGAFLFTDMEDVLRSSELRLAEEARRLVRILK